MTASMPHSLLAKLAAAGAAPRLTWYGTDGERIELSGRVLANWVVKATNLLVEEADAEPGTIVGVHIPVHWRAVVWTLAAWTAGAEATLVGDGDGAADSEADGGARPAEVDVMVSWAPGRVSDSGADLVLAVALGGLARAWDGGPDHSDLPPSTLDAAAEILGYGDELGYTTPPGDDDAALDGVSYGRLAAWAARDAADPGTRALLAPASVRDLLQAAVRTWLAGGSIVLLHPEVAADAQRREQITAEEQVAPPQT